MLEKADIADLEVIEESMEAWERDRATRLEHGPNAMARGMRFLGGHCPPASFRGVFFLVNILKNSRVAPVIRVRMFSPGSAE